jgi:hypothetical protein
MKKRHVATENPILDACHIGGAVKAIVPGGLYVANEMFAGKALQRELAQHGQAAGLEFRIKIIKLIRDQEAQFFEQVVFLGWYFKPGGDADRPRRLWIQSLDLNFRGCHCVDSP